jgi:hypothetical protein
MVLRLGSAFILIGVIAMLVFLLATTIQQGDLRLLAGGAAACAFGLILRRRAGRARRSTRFQTLRRVLGRDEDEDADA